MNEKNEFDALARQKLEGRVIPFEESHWLDMQQLIEAKRGKRRGGAWWFMGTAAALVLAAWLLWPANTDRAIVTEQVTVPTADNVGQGSEPMAPTSTSEEKDQPAATNTLGATSEASETSTSTPADRRTEGPEQDPVEQRASTANTHPARPLPLNNVVRHYTDGGNGRHATVASNTPAAPAVEPDGPVAKPATNADADLPIAAPPVTVVAEPTAPSTTLEPTPSVPVVQTVSTPEGSDGTPVVKVEVNEPPTPPATQPSIAPPPSDPEPIAMGTVVDTSGTASNEALTNTSDSIGTTPAPTPIPPPLVSPTSPWEVGLLAGLFNTTSTYGGGSSATWDVAPQRTFGAGGELMHMGRNFGYGTGLHYGTYADRLRTPEAYRTVVNTSSSWALNYIDTTILVITGSTINDQGDTIYFGQNLNTTVGVLRMDMDSTFEQVRVREAREIINSTSYFEVPLLLDAHLVQGRWSLGFRGGPTVGMLTQRRGSIPAEGEGYTDFNEVALRSWNFGWTARAYVRYRFNSAWSVGLEPAARGQLVDALEERGVTRRSSAIGCMISLSYRLP